jgi:hypothetical protein
MNETEQDSPTGEEAQGGYAEVIRQQFAENPQFKSPAELAARFHEALIGKGQPTLSGKQQQARYQALADLREVRAFTTAAGAEMARTYFVLDGLASRFAAQIARVDLGASQGRAASADLERVGRLLEMVVKCQKEARLCLGASNMMAQDMRALGFSGEVGGVVGGAISQSDG